MNIKSNTVIFLFLCAFKKSFSCPSTCSCRGLATRCGSVMSSYPSGLDATVEYLTIFGNLTHPNSLSSLGKNDLHGTRYLFSLSITFSGVQNIEDEAFSYLTNLRELILADNDIHALKAETFKGLTKLYALDISGNKNCTFDKNTFKYIASIETLNIGNMGIKSLPSDLFIAVRNLKILKLHLNGFEKIHQDLFAPLTALQTLDLNGNHLLGLPVELKQMINGLKHIHFSENPWQCNCQLLWLRELPENLVSSLTDTSEIVCNGPQNLMYHSFVNVPETDFVCIPPKVMRCQHGQYSLDVNNRLDIVCAYRGDPIPEIKWTRPDGFVIDGREAVSGKYHIDKNGTLSIDSVDAVDDGDWTVTAYNSTTHDDVKVNVNVITTTPISTSTVSSTTRHLDSVASISSSNLSLMTSQNTKQSQISFTSAEYSKKLVAGTVSAGCIIVVGIVIVCIIYKNRICNKRINIKPSVENKEIKC